MFKRKSVHVKQAVIDFISQQNVKNFTSVTTTLAVRICDSPEILQLSTSVDSIRMLNHSLSHPVHVSYIRIEEVCPEINASLLWEQEQQIVSLRWALYNQRNAELY